MNLKDWESAWQLYIMSLGPGTHEVPTDLRHPELVVIEDWRSKNPIFPDFVHLTVTAGPNGNIGQQILVWIKKDTNIFFTPDPLTMLKSDGGYGKAQKFLGAEAIFVELAHLQRQWNDDDRWEYRLEKYRDVE